MAETNYVVLDLEWNQSSSAEKADEKMNFEIIEIGAVKLNAKRRIIGEFSTLVKPVVYKELHYFTSRLIHLKMREINDKGIPFDEAMRNFKEWCGEAFVYCTWGPLDLLEIQNNMEYYNMEGLSNGPFPFLDVQKLFSLAFEDGKSRRNLEYAVDFLHIEKDIPFHRAFSDAYYTGKVLAQIPEEYYAKVSYDLFHPPRTKAEEIHVVFDDYAKYISRVFPDKKAAMADWEVLSSKCYICHKNLRKKIRWFTPNNKHYYCVAHCDKHGYMKGKLRIRKAEDEKVYVVKTTKFITEEEMNAIRQRKMNAAALKKKKHKNGG